MIKNILLITNADMSLQSGNVVLVLRRAEELYKIHGIKTVCYLYTKEDTKDIKHKYDYIEFIGNSNSSLGSIVKKYEINDVILYGLKSYRFIRKLNKIKNEYNMRIAIHLDIQGAMEEKIEFLSPLNKIIKFPNFIISKLLLKISLNRVQGAFVVSDELMQYCEKLILPSKRNEFIFSKVRCGVNEIFETHEIIQKRNYIRKKEKIDKDKNIYVFSGYRKPWQNINEIINIFKLIDELDDNSFFAFFCNLDTEFEKQLEREFPNSNYIAKFLKFDEYFDNLMACDVGYIVRDYNTTNHVAFPNKISDYLVSGLVVATNKALPEPYRILESSKIPFIDIEEVDTKEIINIANNRRKSLEKFYEQTNKLVNKELLYSIQVNKLDAFTKWR